MELAVYKPFFELLSLCKSDRTRFNRLLLSSGYATEHPCLYYGWLDTEGKYIKARFFRPGQTFVSVYPDGTGRYHQLSNLSDREIVLEVVWEE